MRWLQGVPGDFQYHLHGSLYQTITALFASKGRGGEKSAGSKTYARDWHKGMAQESDAAQHDEAQRSGKG